MKYKFPALLIEEDNGYFVEFPDLDDVFTQGKTPTEAIENAEDVLNLMLWDKEENNEKIPEPGDLDLNKIQSGKNKKTMLAIIQADTLEYRKSHDTRTVRKNVSIPSWLNQLAIKKNINFSNMLQNALKQELKIE